MQLNLWWSEKLAVDRIKSFNAFAQAMANRLMQGHARYGEPTKEQHYMSRLTTELQAYKKSGNAEQLFNIANYAYLEFVAPENKKFHHNASVDSVTREKFGGELNAGKRG